MGGAELDGLGASQIVFISHGVFGAGTGSEAAGAGVDLCHDDAVRNREV